MKITTTKAFRNKEGEIVLRLFPTDDEAVYYEYQFREWDAICAGANLVDTATKTFHFEHTAPKQKIVDEVESGGKVTRRVYAG